MITTHPSQTIYRVGAPAVEGCPQKSSEIYARTIAALIVCGYYSETRAENNQPLNGVKMSFVVQYNGFIKPFSSKSAARAFARSIRGGGCKPVVREARPTDF